MSCVLVLLMGHSGDGCDLVSTLCRYDLIKGDLFVLSWARVRSSEVGNYLFRAAIVWWRCECTGFSCCLLWLDAWRQ